MNRQTESWQARTVKGPFAAVVLVLCAGGAFAAQIVRDGQPAAEIVLDANAQASVRVAAEQIQKYIAKMSGAKLDLVTAPTGRFRSRLFVGQSAATKALGFTLEDVKHDGYKIWAQGDDVIVAGHDIDWYTEYGFSSDRLDNVDRSGRWREFTGHKWRSPMFLYSRENMIRTGPPLEFHPQIGSGTLYAAFALLEQQGFRWYAPFQSPDEDVGKVIPRKKDLVVPDQETKREPAFAIRNFGYYTATREDALWIKSMGVGMAEFQIPWHASGRILDYEEDPDLAGRINGKPDFSAPRLSGEKFRATFLEYLDCVNRWYPQPLPFVSFCQPDGWSAIDDEDKQNGWDRIATRGQSGRFSDYNWDFATNMRERYNAKYPGNTQRKLVYAYSGTQRIPESLSEMPDDVTIYFTHHSDKVHLSDYRPLAREWLAKIKDAKQFVFYDYYYEHTLYKGERPPVPYVFTENLKQNFEIMVDHCHGWLLEGMVTDWRGGTARGFYRPAINHLMVFLRNRMTWNRELDLDKELDEYCTLFYGPAAEEMRELLRFAEEVWMRKEPRLVTASTGYLKEADVPKFFDLLDRAKGKAGDSVYGRRIALLAQEMEPLKKVFQGLRRQGPELRAFRFTDQQEPQVDGDLTKPFWWYRNEIKPEYTFYPLKDMFTGETPRHISTLVSFRYTHGSLFLAVNCLEPKMDRIQASCTAPDNPDIWSGDFVEIRLETPNGRQPLIVVNPSGAVYDSDSTLPRTEDLPTFYRVAACAVRKLADRWTVEVRIDEAALGAGMPTQSFPWGVQVSRQRLACNTPEFYQLSPTGTAFNRNFEMMANLHAR